MSMRMDITEDDIKYLHEGDLILSKSNDWHRLLKIEGGGYIQDVAGHWSIQHNGEDKTSSIYYIFDRYRFMRKISREELLTQYRAFIGTKDDMTWPSDEIINYDK